MERRLFKKKIYLGKNLSRNSENKSKQQHQIDYSPMKILAIWVRRFADL
jgi:hypothetical protein